MFIERIRREYDPNVPIFTKNILKIFPEYSRAYVFRLIKKAEEKGELVKFSEGVYFMPTETIIGPSTIIADDVVEIKYIKNNDEVYGVYSGLQLLNMFSVTTQVPNVIEVVTNNETTRRREIELDGRKFILRKSRFEINKDNANTYLVLQLFNDTGKEEIINRHSKEIIVNFIKEQKISLDDLLSYAAYFPARAIKNLIRNEILDKIK